MNALRNVGDGAATGLDYFKEEIESSKKGYMLVNW